jgi:FlaA1/EpsC-like NDP-sugar epimerase
MNASRQRPFLPPPTLLDQPPLRQLVKLVLDMGLAALAWVLSGHLFGEASPTGYGVVAWVLTALAFNVAFQLTRQHYRLIGFGDAIRIAAATLGLGIAGVLASSALHAHAGIFNLETVLAATPTTGALWVVLRGAFRVWNEQSIHGTPHCEGQVYHRTLIVGAGRAGNLIAQELKRHPELGETLVGFVDDALNKQGIRIQGTPVLGTSQLLHQIVREHSITRVVLAIPSVPGPVIRQLHDSIRATGVEVKTVPGLFDLLGTQTWKPELRDISIEDLLRREPIQLDQGSLNQMFEESVVLVTGGGGSIGSELARQVAAFRPARIVLLGRGENSLWETERSLRVLFPNQALSLELCDIRNPTRLRQSFERWQPQVVLHAAAHKHVPYLEAHPEEAVENNIFGTQNVVHAALAAGVPTLVNISTDKAVNPTNVLGASKRIGECLVLRAAQSAPEGTRLMSVRFGNVLGSRGSVIPIFKDQIARGGPLTVTHPDMTRYFMTIPEASQLVLQAAALGDTAKVYVLDMGAPVKIVDLATDMARLSGLTPGEDIDLQFTGIRPGEKLFEELFSDQEQSSSEVHPKVFNAAPEEVSGDLLEEGLSALRRAMDQDEGTRQLGLLRGLQQLVPTYAPSPTGLGRYGLPRVNGRGASGAHPIYLSPSRKA